ncbi:hypothetical protein [Bifidobacterium asteroides]|uniref:hypothetical protein n=1 Tax=Bifidobacterium asteroides TaxID=1684 RepID=UPI002741D4A1|nr:hypothetical protein [Bifidobacterium asteroides]WLT11219.1 hypothetical protein RAM15_02925 [Bifidobacterium asteroides]
MTEHKHNDAGKQYNSEAGTGSPQGDEEWADFLNSHADELGSLESSRTAKEFEKKARKSEKKAALRAEDLKRDSFVGGSGPRDFQGSSWLDTDEVMDQSSNFVPPNPDLSDLGRRRVAFIDHDGAGPGLLLPDHLHPPLVRIDRPAGGPAPADRHRRTDHRPEEFPRRFKRALR